jgi:hypothetical protein
LDGGARVVRENPAIKATSVAIRRTRTAPVEVDRRA